MKNIIWGILCLAALSACTKSTDDVDSFGACKAGYIDDYNSLRASFEAYKEAYQKSLDTESAELDAKVQERIKQSDQDCKQFFAKHAGVSCQGDHKVHSDDFKPYCDVMSDLAQHGN